MIDKLTAILSLIPSAQVTINNGKVEWHGLDTPPITDFEIDEQISRLQADYDSKKYQRDRASAYPSIQEQLDMQYWDSINGTTVWQDTIQAIKAKYPKGV